MSRSVVTNVSATHYHRLHQYTVCCHTKMISASSIPRCREALLSTSAPLTTTVFISTQSAVTLRWSAPVVFLHVEKCVINVSATRYHRLHQYTVCCNTKMISASSIPRCWEVLPTSARLTTTISSILWHTVCCHTKGRFLVLDRLVNWALDWLVK